MKKLAGIAVMAMFAGVTLVGCVTTDQIGKGNFYFTAEAKEGYQGYLAEPDYRDGMKVHSAFAINPVSDRWHWSARWGGTSPRSRAVTTALDKCGAGCYLFDVNKEIVWQDFDVSKIADVIEAGKNFEETSDVKYYNESVFKISATQLAKFNSKYKSDVANKEASTNYAFVIGSNGYVDWLYSKGRDSYYNVIELAFNTCRNIAKNQKCAVYAVNDDLLTE